MPRPALIFVLSVAAAMAGGALLERASRAEAQDLVPLLNAPSSAPMPAPAWANVSWLNADHALRLEELRGRVVLLNFWVFTCYNCTNTVPSLVNFDRKYRDRGLTIVGIHTPEFPPYAGATPIGLLPGQTSAAGSFTHGWPFAPETGAGADFAGTDRIFTAPGQTAFNDGYSAYAGRVQGANAMTLDYASLLVPGRTITTFTLGIAADDFQRPALGQPYSVTVNGSVHAGLSGFLNSINQTGPSTQFFTFGLDPKLLTGSSLALTITQTGDGRDGWAVDYLTVGVETQPVVTATPEPATVALAASGLLGLAAVARRRRA